MRVYIDQTELYPVWELRRVTANTEWDASEVPDELVARLAKAEREYFECLQLIHKAVTVEIGKPHHEGGVPDCPWSETSGPGPREWWEKP
jgi:hypothetical protein